MSYHTRVYCMIDTCFFPSGILVEDDTPKDRIPEILATSGHAFLYFYSDAAYNLTGFNITYK